MAARIALLLMAAATGMLAEDRNNQFWPQADIFVRTGDHSRLYFLVSGKRTEEEGNTDGQLGAHVDFYFTPIFEERAQRHPDVSRYKFLMLRTGYLFNQTPKDSAKSSTEHTLLIELTPRFYLPKRILLADRNRGELRFVNGEFTPRYRNRLRMERTFPVGKKSLTPLAQAEVFYDWRYNSFHRQRYTAGCEIAFNQRIVLEAYYLRQEDSKSSIKSMNVLGVTLQVYLH